ncbi:MAG TPA: EF-hand domain-containing protein [Gemmataceae bacterium]|nr:EF-hand domain-containing protein [Gemmataceae bacterium]
MRLTKFLAAAGAMACLVVLSAQGQPPPGDPKGKGPKGLKGLKGGPPDTVVLLEEVKATGRDREKACDIVNAYDAKVRDAVRQARKQLVEELKGTLSEADLKVFREALDRVPLMPPIPPDARQVPANDLIERVMGFDKNGDGKISRDELPERMHALFDEGDTNRDGILDREEIRRLANRPPPDRDPPGRPGGEQ